jgi:hypothetical protein
MKSNHLAIIGLGLLALVPPAAAQSEKENETDAEVRRRIAEARRRVLVEQSVRANATVVVRMRNGEKIQGVVKNGRFVERATGLGFSESEREEEGAGIRMWYYDQTNSVMFLPYTMIADCQVLRRLTEVEVKELAQKYEEEERLAKERAVEADRKRLADLAAKKQESGKDRELMDKLGKLTVEQEAEAKLQEAKERGVALLKEFPLEQGWSPERLRDIQIRKVTLGVFPSAQEKRFIEVFEEWKATLDRLKKETAVSEPPTPAPVKK